MYINIVCALLHDGRFSDYLCFRFVWGYGYVLHIHDIKLGALMVGARYGVCYGVEAWKGFDVDHSPS